MNETLKLLLQPLSKILLFACQREKINIISSFHNQNSRVKDVIVAVLKCVQKKKINIINISAMAVGAHGPVNLMCEGLLKNHSRKHIQEVVSPHGISANSLTRVSHSIIMCDFFVIIVC